MINAAFGNPKGDPLAPDWKRISDQSKNILDEYNELMDAIAAKDMTEVRDAICDILVFTLGVGYIAGVPVNQDMDAVQVSNQSKFCGNDVEVAETVKKYADLGVETYVDGEFPMKRVKSTHEQTDLKGAIYRANKMLKCVKFKEPVFAYLD